jgi:hypothetical protein
MLLVHLLTLKILRPSTATPAVVPNAVLSWDTTKLEAEGTVEWVVQLHIRLLSAPADDGDCVGELTLTSGL